MPEVRYISSSQNHIYSKWLKNEFSVWKCSIWILLWEWRHKITQILWIMFPYSGGFKTKMQKKMNTLLSFKWLNLFSFSPLFSNLLRTRWILIILKSHFNYCIFFFCYCLSTDGLKKTVVWLWLIITPSNQTNCYFCGAALSCQPIKSMPQNKNTS